MDPLDLNLDLGALPDEATRQAIVRLLNLVEHLVAENRSLREENQRLRDEISRIQGEQAKPKFLPNRKPKSSRPPKVDFSSEQERHESQPWHKSPKLDRIPIHRTQVCRVDRSLLPPDAQFKRFEPVVVQDLILRPLNTRFLKEVFYSPSQRRTYSAELPTGYWGSFGPAVSSLALSLAYGRLVSHEAIHALFTDVGLLISDGKLSDLLTQGHARFHEEKRAIARAGLASSPWQQLDVTPTRVDGQNAACHVLCNPLYTCYETMPTQERLSALWVLQAGMPRTYRLDADALAALEAARVAGKVRRPVAEEVARTGGSDWGEVAFEEWLDSQLPRAGPQQRQRVREAAALAWYRAQEQIPQVKLLVCDDAAQFRGLTGEVSLCWVHEGRHYKKLCPYLPEHQRQVEAFRKQFWEYYRKLVAYQKAPSEEEAARLSSAFDALFGTRTGYWQLDERIEKTQGKKAELLVGLEHPEVPWHNNASELGARRRVRKRDVSFGPRSEAGRQAWDTFQTLAATATKLGISFYQYLHDRISGANRLPSLASVIQERAAVLQLGASWETV